MFILLVSQVLNDASAPISATKVEDLETAYMRLHQEMASGYANQNMVSCLAQVMNENGTICKTDYFNRAEEEAEPVEP